MNFYDYSLKGELLIEHYKHKFGRYAKIVAKLNRRKLYFPCLEVPITTYCTLCCKDCSNLIQYYSTPYHVPIDTLIESIENICQIANGIDCIRILVLYLDRNNSLQL